MSKRSRKRSADKEAQALSEHRSDLESADAEMTEDELDLEEYDEEDEEEEDEEGEEDEEFEAEFSLEDLSQAYAGVVKKHDDSSASSQVPKKRRGQLVADKIANKESAEEVEEEASDEVDDDVVCPISPESIIESILFVGAPKGEKLNSRKIAAVMRDVSPKEVTKTTKELNSRYESENTAYRIRTEKDGSIRMVMAEDLESFQNEYYGRNRQIQLAQNAVDVLAVIAYRQPVTKKEIEITRGKPIGNVLQQLVRRNLLTVEETVVQPAGKDGATKSKRKEKRYSTTDRFLDLFQLDSLEDLPQSQDVSSIDEFAD